MADGVPEKGRDGISPAPTLTASSTSGVSSVQLRPHYYRRPSRAESSLLRGVTPSDDDHTPHEAAVDALQLRQKPSRVVSGVMMIENDEHQNIEGNVELVKSLTQQRTTLLYCAAAVLTVVTSLVLAWVVLRNMKTDD